MYFFVYILQGKVGKMGKKWKESHTTKVTKIPKKQKTKIWDERNKKCKWWSDFELFSN